jgi:transcriptional regulator with XRE-family HTH domain
MMSDTESFDATYATVVGARLRSVRKQKRLSLQAVATASDQEFKASVLGAYERGERAISVPRLQRLARLYDVPVEQLLPDGLGPERSAAETERAGRVRIDLNALKDAEAPEAAALQRFLATIQVERQDFNGRVLTIRRDDLRVIGATFGLGADEMVSRLNTLGVIFDA